MLLSAQAKEAVDDELDRLSREMLQYLVRDRPGALPIMEQVYIAGKVAAKIGPNKLKKMSEKDLKAWVDKNGLARTVNDKAFLATLESQANMMMAGVLDTLNRKIRQSIDQADKQWTKELMLRDQTGNLQKSIWSDLRDSAFGRFFRNMGDIFTGFRDNLDGFVQTVAAQFFQTGQQSEIGGDELIYKIPRETACPYCMSLHLDDSGDYRIYRLDDVVGNSNIGVPAAEWEFTIGPVHPNCYCILYRVEQDPPVRNEDLADAREETVGAYREKTAEAAERYRSLAAAADARLDALSAGD